MNPNCKHCGFPSVAVIPMPVEEKGTKNADVPVCERCCQRAIKKCYYVVRYDETEGEAGERFFRLVNEKHNRLGFKQAA